MTEYVLLQKTHNLHRRKMKLTSQPEPQTFETKMSASIWFWCKIKVWTRFNSYFNTAAQNMCTFSVWTCVYRSLTWCPQLDSTNRKISNSIHLTWIWSVCMLLQKKKKGNFLKAGVLFNLFFFFFFFKKHSLYIPWYYITKHIILQ